MRKAVAAAILAVVVHVVNVAAAEVKKMTAEAAAAEVGAEMAVLGGIDNVINVAASAAELAVGTAAEAAAEAKAAM